ncbi:MAG: hypothetical protein EA392_02280 [Cryomorphaceae bacterium]|nr:MAG: hypothetical protein EA392_02280 [Cryomorphaceae bacterium]
MMQLPAGFEEMCGHLCDFPELKQALNQPAVTSIRRHPLKPNSSQTALESVPWCPHGYYLQERPNFSHDPLLYAGAYYVQEASSMLLWHVLEQLQLPKKNLRVLDLCAAPGGKSTLILDWLENKGMLVTNEVVAKRTRILSENMERWGYANRIVTQSEPEAFARSGAFFDLVVVDAPCSGEGMFRKEPDALAMWSESNVQHSHNRQCSILDSAARCVAPGGVLIYSTCTYNEKENEGSVKHLLETHQAQVISMDVPEKWGVTVGGNPMTQGLRCFPHKVKGEGFFIAAVQFPGEKQAPREQGKKRKNYPALHPAIGPWLQNPGVIASLEHRGEHFIYPTAMHELVEELTKKIHVLSVGTKAGKLAGKELIPHHALALSLELRNDSASYQLNADEAAQYMARETLNNTGGLAGWCLMKHQGVALGWGKATGGIVKNKWPLRVVIRK